LKDQERVTNYLGALVKNFLGMQGVKESKQEKTLGEVLHIFDFNTIRTPHLTYPGMQKGAIRNMTKQITLKHV